MIYIHVPFCRSFCTYCDFYSETACSDSAQERYVSEVCAEALRRQGEIAGTAGVNTLYMGGGTPSVLSLDAFRRILDALPPSGYEEFTVEVNPDDIVKKGDSYVRGLLALGVNRFSMGVQSLDDGILSWMNRRHSAADAVEAFRILRRCGADNISLDVIFGLNGLENAVLGDTLEKLTALGPEHISAYQLTVEEGGTLAEMIEDGRYREAPEELCRAQYEQICSFLREKGYRHYEISNWAKPGRESIHNSAYWKRLPYVGLGPGAHSFLINGDRQMRSWNSEVLHGWTSDGEILSPEEIREEEVMLGMRMAENLPADEAEWFIADSLVSEKLASVEG